jgi:hypothetical protein
MRIGDAFLPETPIDDIPHGQFFLESMANTETHPAHNADGHSIFIYPLLSTNITLHLLRSSLPNSKQCFQPILLRKRPKIKGDYEIQIGSLRKDEIP